MKRYVVLGALLLCAGCVTNRYPNVDSHGKQAQPWGDPDMGNPFPYHWRCSERGKDIVRWNKQMDQFYRTNSVR